MAGLPALAAPLDPFAYTSLGALNVTSGNISFDFLTNTLTAPGGIIYSAAMQAQPGGPDIAVFTFDSVNITTGAVPILSNGGHTPIAILSRSDMVFGGTVSRVANGSTVRADVLAGSGAGFGGAGGGPGGGAPYGNLLNIFEGGSRGGSFATVAGGGGFGGEALQLVAAGTLSVSGSVTATGGSGNSAISKGTFGPDGAGGGSGGGILLAASEVLVTGTIGAAGGKGGSSQSGTIGSGGAGGGGGRVVVVPSTYTLGSLQADVSGGAPGSGPTSFGSGAVGTAELTPTSLVINPTGVTFALTNGIVSDGNFTVSYAGKSIENQGTVTQAAGSTTTAPSFTNAAGATTSINGGTLTASKVVNGAGAVFTVAGGTVTATSFSNAGDVNLAGGTLSASIAFDPGQTFTYTGGTFAGRLTNNGGTLNLPNAFTAGDGMQNNTDLTLATGKSITSNGQGLENNAILTLAGGTLNGNGVLTNNAFISGFGTIGGSGGFTNNLGLAVTGGNLTLSNTGTNTNLGQVDLSTGRLLSLSGATLSNQGGLALAGGGVGGTGTLRNESGGILTGKGSVTANFVNAAGGTVLLDQAGTTNISKAFGNAGVIHLTQDGANLTGGKITSTGLIYGRGNIGNAIDNTGIIRAEGGTLQLNSNAVTNQAGGRIEAGTGNTVLLAQGLAGNAGDILLTGGRVDTNGKALVNTGRIMGQGILATGGLTNNGQLSLGAGSSSVIGAVTNNGTATIDHATVSFLGAVTNNAGATMTVNHSTVSYLGGFTNSGILVTDPTTLVFTSITNNDPAAIVADPGDAFQIKQDLLGDTGNNTGWKTDQATLAFIDGGTDLHRMDLYGIDKGAARSGLTDNFAWGTVTLDAGQTLTLADIKADGFSGALYLGTLELAGYTGGSLAAFILGAIDGNGFNIYYDPLLSGNSYLGGLTYALGDGGSLIALQDVNVPEPATIGMLLAGVPPLLLARRRRARSARVA